MLPKPKPCEQIWEQMTPSIGGRRCELCSKIIVDFSRMKWSDIRRIQAEGGYSVCGLYSEKQIENWDGVNETRNKGKLLKWLGFLFWMSSVWPSYGQTKSVEIKIHGTVSGPRGKIPGVKIRLVGTEQSSISDSLGTYELLIKERIPSDEDMFLVFEKSGYGTTELGITEQVDTTGYDAYLPIAITREDIQKMPRREIISYYVSTSGVPKPNFWKRVGMTLTFWKRKYPYYGYQKK